MVGLATGEPPQGATGRALAAVAARPEARLLAAELLQRMAVAVAGKSSGVGESRFGGSMREQLASLGMRDSR